MQRGSQGQWVRQTAASEPFHSFIPVSLPPDPPIRLDELSDLLERANRALGKLDGVSLLLPDISIFLYLYVRKEAVLSSQIEGMQSSLSDLLLYENVDAPGVPLDDVREVSQYVAALEYGLKRIGEGFPLSSRFLREIHTVLLSHGRGSEKLPGEFRRSQNWIGGTRPGNALFVPPPHHEASRCMGELENFLHDTNQRTPALIKAALAHVQFETIHPFLDGNGRIGRLLITLLLCSEGALEQPMLYLSYYFKANRSSYYELLMRVRTEGDWEAWLSFFLEGVRATAEQASQTARNVLRLFDEDRHKIEDFGRATGSALRVHHALQRRPLTTLTALTHTVNLSYPAVTSAVGKLQEVGIVREISGRQRDRIFVYDKYLALLNEGTELPVPKTSEEGE